MCQCSAQTYVHKGIELIDSRHFLKPGKQRNKNSKKSEKTICTV